MAERKSREHRYEVLVSFNGLDRGERFSSPDDAWTRQHVDAGYIQDVTEESAVGRAQGSVAPVADEDKVQEAKDAGRGEVGQG